MAEQPPPLNDSDDDLFADSANVAVPPKVKSDSMTNVANKTDDLFDSAADEIDLNDNSDALQPTATLALNAEHDMNEHADSHGDTPVTTSSGGDEAEVSNEKEPLSSTTHEASEPARLSPPTLQSQATAPFAPADLPPAEKLQARLTTPTKDPSEKFDTGLDGPKYEFEVSVPSYEKRGDGLRSTYIVYKVVFKSKDIPVFKQSQYEVMRRFSDFLGLYQKLASKYLSKGHIVPPPPEKSIVGNARTKMAKDEESHPAEFLEGRRQQLERYLHRTAQHPVLLTDCDFVDFVTLNVDLPKASNTSTLSLANINRLVSRVSDTLNKIALQMNETDQWFEDKMLAIDSLYDAISRLIAAADATVHYRREMSSSITSLCAALSMLASCEENTSLSRALSQLAETQEKIALCHQEQADKDLYLMAGCWRDQLHMLDAVKTAFNERQKTYQLWQSAQVSLTKKRENKTRLELQGNGEKVPAARAECQEQATRVANIEAQFENMSKVLKAELERWDAQRVQEIKETLVKYIETLALTQQQLIKYWEAYVPEAKAILDVHK